jgi:hypothetical protein
MTEAEVYEMILMHADQVEQNEISDNPRGWISQ